MDDYLTQSLVALFCALGLASWLVTILKDRLVDEVMWKRKRSMHRIVLCRILGAATIVLVCFATLRAIEVATGTAILFPLLEAGFFLVIVFSALFWDPEDMGIYFLSKT